MMRPFPRGSYLPLLYLHVFAPGLFGTFWHPADIVFSMDAMDAVHAKECSWFGAFRVRCLESFSDQHRSPNPSAFQGGENQMKMVPGVCWTWGIKGCDQHKYRFFNMYTQARTHTHTDTRVCSIILYDFNVQPLPCNLALLQGTQCAYIAVCTM